MVQAGPPAGPRGQVGASAEVAAASFLRAAGWSILARNIRLGRDELDIVALEPGPRSWLVLVEVRSGSGPAFGSPRESVDARKVARLYRAGLALRRLGHPGLDRSIGRLPWRVDLLTLIWRAGAWHVEAHLRGLEPP